MWFSIVIPAFNRSFCVGRAIKSAQDFLGNDCESEIIVIDDGSTDDTTEVVGYLISSSKVGPRITLHKHRANQGVCAAKNTGAKAARGEWIIFLDSDDELIPESYAAVIEALAKESRHSLHFFTCIDENDAVVGQSHGVLKRNFNQYVRYGTNGEKLPIIKRAVFIENLYDEDMPGYESLAYMRIVRVHGFACIHELTVRRYYTSNQDRLSTAANFKRRSAKLAKGHLRALNEHASQLNYVNKIRFYLKYINSLIRGLEI